MKLIKTEFKTIQAYDDKMTFYFEITRMRAQTHDSSFGGYPWKAVITVDIPADIWKRFKKHGHLGSLYLDFSNTVYQANPNVHAWNPTVDDGKNAKKGIKTITLTYYSQDFGRAEKVGLKVTRLKNGEAFLGFGTQSDIQPVGIS